MGSAGRPADPDPFWNYEEVALFVGAIFPAFLVSALLVSTANTILPGVFGGEGMQTLTFQLLLYVLLLGVIHLMFWLRHDRPMWRSLGWTMQFRGAWLCIVLAPFLAFGIAFLGTLLNAPILLTPVETLFDGQASMVAIGLFAVLLGPLFEELIFRGFLFPLLRKTFGAVGGVLGAAIPFALLHGPQYEWHWQHLLLLTLAGSAFGAMRQWRGSTAASALLHASYNLTLFVGQILQSHRFRSYSSP